MEFVLGTFIRFPGIFQALGLGLASLSISAITFGLRLGRRLDRMEHATSRVGSAIQIQLDQVLPWWLTPFVPETGWGFAAWTVLGGVGLLTAAAAKKIRKAYH